MRLAAILLGPPLLLAMPASVLAECSLDYFDQTPPAAIRREVDTQHGRFIWASDFDRKSNFNWVWNYISNTHTTSDLNVSWAKGHINQSFVKPLPAGTAVCAEYLVNDLTEDDIDDDAPIIYGTINATQPAAVYAKKQVASDTSRQFISRISSSYRTDSGEIRGFYVEIFFDVSSAGLVEDLGIVSNDDVYVGISGLESVWAPSTVDSFVEMAKAQSVPYDLAPPSKFTLVGDKAAEFLAASANPDDVAIFFKGSVKRIALGERVKATVQNEVVVLDAERNPILIGQAVLPVTVGGQN